ncbi:hypothetical protein Sjap_026004 [Stephania japonica]|uniref:Uncharacterized protein n=1 Tax=Stephania japonica TaxID=461633 RepID=A0AAP0E5V8_9MAGN
MWTPESTSQTVRPMHNALGKCLARRALNWKNFLLTAQLAESPSALGRYCYTSPPMQRYRITLKPALLRPSKSSRSHDCPLLAIRIRTMTTRWGSSTGKLWKHFSFLPKVHRAAPGRARRRSATTSELRARSCPYIIEYVWYETSWLGLRSMMLLKFGKALETARARLRRQEVGMGGRSRWRWLRS